MARNPFHHLYVGEKVSAEEFADIFSTTLVSHAMPLFQPGHVVLTGTNGMGKSMLFKLLESDVRIAYEDACKPFPVPEEASRFIGAGINVNTARCNEFGNRRTPDGDHLQELMFGDFLNYWIVLDMLRSVERLASCAAVVRKLGLNFDRDQREMVAANLASDPVWDGYLERVTGYEDLKATIERRIFLYRRYMNANDRKLNPVVENTKTSAGEPMKVVVQHLRCCGVVPSDVPFFILIDQYEELATITNPDGGKADYRSIVNKVLNSRDPTLSYRIGTRGYGWRNHLHIFGTDARLEQERDFKLVELDTKLRRQENSNTSVFPDFARDVFGRRIRHAAKTEVGVDKTMTIVKVLGHSFQAADEARILAGENPQSVVKTEPDWPINVIAFLKALANDDPLSARLGEAWMRQKGVELPIASKPLPWNEKIYWRKERVEVALLQIAGSQRQRAILSGEDDVIALSGSNILIFLSICQLIWDFASQASKREDKQPEIPIKWQIQTIGATRAGRNWLDRITTEYGRSDNRFKLIQKMGEKFASILLPDRKMSNPGQNGISLSIEELMSKPEIYSFLIEAVDYGNLVMSEHATRNKDRRRRLKFYLNPLYCPIYRIPFQRSKEPLYLSIAEFEGWLGEADIIERLERPLLRKRNVQVSKTPLLDLLEKEE